MEITKDEINKRIHTEIMGECWHDIQKGTVIATAPSGRIITSPKCRVCRKTGVRNPDYCGDIKEAFKVVDKIKEREIYLCLNGSTDSAYFYKVDNYHELGRFKVPFEKITEPDTAKAIGLAALKTLEQFMTYQRFTRRPSRRYL